MRKKLLLSFALATLLWGWASTSEAACGGGIIYCEWRTACKTEPGGWTTTWREKWCYNYCMYWEPTGEKCCYTTQPGSC